MDCCRCCCGVVVYCVWYAVCCVAWCRGVVWRLQNLINEKRMLSFSFSSFMFFHFPSFSFIFFQFLSCFFHFLSFYFIFFHFLACSFMFYHFLSFSIIFYHFLPFSFSFYHFLSVSLSLLGAQYLIFWPQFRYDFS